MKKNFHVFSMLLLLGSLQINLCAMQDDEDDQPKSSSAQTFQAPSGQERPLDSGSSARVTSTHQNVGLINGGRNICYLNSVVQCLSNLKAFRLSLLRSEKVYYEGPLQNALVFNLIKLFKDLRTTTSEQAIINQTFVGLAKKLIEEIPANKEKLLQDADEFLTLLLSQINEPNKISLVLQLEQTVRCLGAEGVEGCQHKSQRNETFKTIALPLHNVATHNTLQELLSDFFASSFAHGYSCNACGKADTSFKSSKILENHDELIITLKRFNTDGSKISTPVLLPMQLDLKPYAADAFRQREGVNLLYELVGFICHGSNHYISFVKDFENGKWYAYNDSAADEINVQLIQGITASGSFSLNSQNFTPYILFYQKKSQVLAQPAVKQSETEDEDFDSSDDEAGLQSPPGQRRKYENEQAPQVAKHIVEPTQQTKGFFSRFHSWITGNSQREETLRNQEEARLQAEAIKKRQEELRAQAEALEKRQNVGLMKVEALPYLNSVIQCLSNLKKFKAGLFASEKDYKDNFLILSLINLIKELKVSSEPVADQNFVDQAKILVQQSKNKETAFQVADEFLNLLFGQLHNSEKKTLNALVNVITQCLKEKDILGCEYSSDEYGFEQTKTTLCPNQLKSVQEILAAHFSPFFDKNYTCKCCHQAATSVMVQRVLSCPSELIISLKRFDQSGNKDLSPIALPMMLDLKPFLANELMQRIDQVPYELVGIVCCNRNSQYYSYTKDFGTGKWFRYNDESIVEVKEPAIKSMADSGIDSQSFVPYILFYALKESECHPNLFPMQQSPSTPKDREKQQEIIGQMTKIWSAKKQQEQDLQRARTLAQFSDKSLVNAHLDGADLTGLDLNGADLTGASLVGAKLIGTKLNGATLTNAKLNNATLSDVQLCNATLKNTDLSNSTITNITAHHITISDGTKFENATISSLILKDVVIQNVSFANAKLKNVKFSNSLIDHVNMMHIQAEEMYFNESLLMNIDFSRACITGIDINNAAIIGNNLNFRYATIKTGCIRGKTISRTPKSGERTDGITEIDGGGQLSAVVTSSTFGVCTGAFTILIPIPGVGTAVGAGVGLTLAGIELLVRDAYLDSQKDFGISNINSILLNSDFYGTSLEDMLIQHVKLGNCTNIGRIRKAVGTLFDNIVSSNPKDLDDLRHKGACVNEVPADEFKVLWPTKGNDGKDFWVRLLAGAAQGTISGSISKYETSLRDAQFEAKYKSFIEKK